MKIKFDRTITYHEQCEAEVDSDDPVRCIVDNDFDKFLVVSRTVVDVELGEVTTG